MSDAPKVFKGGTLRLTAAEEVRAQERGGAGFGDQWELAGAWRPGKSIHYVDGDHPFAKQFQISGGRWLEFTQGSAILPYTPGLLFSASATRGPELCARMKAEFGYDGVFAISDFEALGRAIARALGQPVTVGSVEYTDPDERDAWQAYAAMDGFHKATRFQWQNEIRCLAGGGEQSQIVKIPGLWRWVSHLQRI